MPALCIELTKLRDGGALLRCIRADGSLTVQRNEGRRGRFFALHDLRHYAVESVLRYSQAFYGLLAAGWEIADTTGKGPRRDLAGEALTAEHLVGMLDADSTNECASSAADFNKYAAAFAKEHKRKLPPPLSDQNLADIRRLESSLHAEWLALREGETMKLRFPSSL